MIFTCFEYKYKTCFTKQPPSVRRLAIVKNHKSLVFARDKATLRLAHRR